jgi:hypothetical protein
MTNDSAVARAHRGLAFLFLALSLVAFFFAGLGAFGAESYTGHQHTGRTLVLLSFVLLVLAAIGRRSVVQQSAVLFGLMIVQMLLGVAGEDVGILGGLHPINALLIVFVAHQAARGLPLPFGAGRAEAPAARG